MTENRDVIDYRQRMRLFTPGPVSVSKDILAELAAPSIFHRYEDFQFLYRDTITRLERLFGCSSDHVCVLLSGSGTLACETVLSSVFGANDIVLVVSNGDFADRWAKLLELHGVQREHQRLNYFAPVIVESIIQRVHDIKATGVVMVAMETSTGMVNPIKEVGLLLYEEFDGRVEYFVDAVSALGSESLDMADSKITYCASVVNKALEGPPGLSMACINYSSWCSRKRASTSLYLDLGQYLKYREECQTPYTPAIPQIRALNLALKKLDEEGNANRRQRYKLLTEELIHRLESGGILPTIAKASLRSPAVTTFSLPKAIKASELKSYLLERGLVVWFPTHYSSPEGNELMTVSVMGEIYQSDIWDLANSICDFCSIQRV